MLAWMFYRPTNNPNSSSKTKTSLLHQPQDCENDRKSRLALAFTARTYIHPREALVTGFLNKALCPGPLSGLETKTTPPHAIHGTCTSQGFPGLGREEEKDKGLGVLQSSVGPGFYLSCLWLLQFKSCLPLRQEGPASPWTAVQ